MYDINFDDLDGSDYALMSWELAEAQQALTEYLLDTQIEEDIEQYYSEEYA